MKSLLHWIGITMLSACAISAQILPSPLSFSVDGDFQNPIAQSGSSVLVIDNDLSNGYRPEMDLKDAPASLTGSNLPSGASMFQWGVLADWMPYPHTSALWFEPIEVINAIPEQNFDIGRLYYRNGTITSGSGSNGVELNFRLNFSQPANLAPVDTVFASTLINTINGDDPVASADIVSLNDILAPLEFTDAQGRQYYLELTFKVDQTTIDGTLSTESEFRVFEGQSGSADLLGRFTVRPTSIPEPSSAILAALSSLALLRRRR
jgi:hypothetical protein